MQSKGCIQWEVLCYSCGYLVTMVTIDVLKMYQRCYQRCYQNKRKHYNAFFL